LKPRIAASPNLKRMLVAFLGLAIASPVVIGNFGTPAAPEWLGGVLALAALFGALIVLAKMRMLRARYVVLFAMSLVAAAVVGRFVA
jgi:hypothetical protein